ncbi:XRE family transcriptional regulator [Photobacterium aquae]|uniref:XRE family transcriptional regulator n=1 Tax=Photobacterium aquae TaxID=1195763 RepID=A0A0J1GX65_9GAMM|nr:helix-turn-helix transcriptional regulator [Photobacterium aquae]KLV04039.1 XRE family transcriptional regulator [Photobacterium aquae]
MKTDKRNVRIIHQDGQPVFAVIPYHEYIKLVKQEADADSKTYLPHEVAEIMLVNDVSYITAWRKHLNISQKELAQRMGISQAAVSQMENIDSNPQREMLKKAAKALDVSVDQLID